MRMPSSPSEMSSSTAPTAVAMGTQPSCCASAIISGAPSQREGMTRTSRPAQRLDQILAGEDGRAHVDAEVLQSLASRTTLESARISPPMARASKGTLRGPQFRERRRQSVDALLLVEPAHVEKPQPVVLALDPP